MAFQRGLDRISGRTADPAARRGRVRGQLQVQQSRPLTAAVSDAVALKTPFFQP